MFRGVALVLVALGLGLVLGAGYLWMSASETDESSPVWATALAVGSLAVLYEGVGSLRKWLVADAVEASLKLTPDQVALGQQFNVRVALQPLKDLHATEVTCALVCVETAHPVNTQEGSPAHEDVYRKEEILASDLQLQKGRSTLLEADFTVYPDAMHTVRHVAYASVDWEVRLRVSLKGLPDLHKSETLLVKAERLA